MRWVAGGRSRCLTCRTESWWDVGLSIMVGRRFGIAGFRMLEDGLGSCVCGWIVTKLEEQDEAQPCDTLWGKF